MYFLRTDPKLELVTINLLFLHVKGLSSEVALMIRSLRSGWKCPHNVFVTVFLG